MYGRLAILKLYYPVRKQIMELIKVKTRKFLPPQDNILEELDKRLPKLKEGDVLLIASKILAIHQGRCIKKIRDPRNKIQKKQLVQAESDYSLPSYMVGKTEIVLTIKDYTLIPAAGIDESNGNGYYI